MATKSEGANDTKSKKERKKKRHPQNNTTTNKAINKRRSKHTNTNAFTRQDDRKEAMENKLDTQNTQCNFKTRTSLFGVGETRQEKEE